MDVYAESNGHVTAWRRGGDIMYYAARTVGSLPACLIISQLTDINEKGF